MNFYGRKSMATGFAPMPKGLLFFAPGNPPISLPAAIVAQTNAALSLPVHVITSGEPLEISLKISQSP
jgi:hypothetical protein